MQDNLQKIIFQYERLYEGLPIHQDIDSSKYVEQILLTRMFLDAVKNHSKSNEIIAIDTRLNGVVTKECFLKTNQTLHQSTTLFINFLYFPNAAGDLSKLGMNGLAYHNAWRLTEKLMTYYTFSQLLHDIENDTLNLRSKLEVIKARQEIENNFLQM